MRKEKKGIGYKIETQLIMLRFRFCKIKNRLINWLSFRRQKLIEENEIIEINKKNLNGGCMYYSTGTTPRKFIKGQDVFKTYEVECECLKRLNPDNKKENYLRHYKTILPKTVTLEYTDWLDLDKYSKKNKLSKDDSKRLGKFLINILKDFEENHIVHRDLRPQNVLVAKINGLLECKVIDFGFALIDGKDRLNPKRMMDRRALSTLGEDYYGESWDDSCSAYRLMKKYSGSLSRDFLNDLMSLCTEETKREIEGETNE